MRSAVVIAAASLSLLVACGGHSSSGATGPVASNPIVVSPSSRPPCPIPHGQACLGNLDPGTYTTAGFQPGLKYTVPAGWANDEDTQGNFMLLPPVGQLAGVDADTSDFIGVYTSVLAHANACPTVAEPKVGTSAGAIMRWLRRDPALQVTVPQRVTVGGLHGFVTTVRMAKDWRLTCPYSHGEPVAPLIVGSESTFLDHNVIAGQATRLYLLNYQIGALAIEVVDIHDAGHLAAYSRLVSNFEFQS